MDKKMPRHISLLVLFVILLLNIGCSGYGQGNVSDCEQLKDVVKRDRCFIKLTEGISSNNSYLKIKNCEKITDTETKDICYFKVIRDGWRYIHTGDIESLCGNISSITLKESCDTFHNRPHMSVIR